MTKIDFSSTIDIFLKLFPLFLHSLSLPLLAATPSSTKENRFVLFGIAVGSPVLAAFTSVLVVLCFLRRRRGQAARSQREHHAQAGSHLTNNTDMELGNSFLESRSKHALLTHWAVMIHCNEFQLSKTSKCLKKSFPRLHHEHTRRCKLVESDALSTVPVSSTIKSYVGLSLMSY